MHNTIHRIWLGGDMPERFQSYGALWQSLNPGYEVHDWTEEEVWDRRWINQNVIDNMREQAKNPEADMVAFYTHVADVIDYETIYEFGGWYFNTDLKPLKPLATLEFDPSYAAFANEDDVHLVNMAMYCPPGDPFVGKIIELLPERYFGMPGAFMNATTGVQLIMQAYTESGGRVQRFHRNVFNPIHWSEVAAGELPDLNRDYPEESVAVHEWLHRTNQRGQRVLEQ